MLAHEAASSNCASSPATATAARSTSPRHARFQSNNEALATRRRRRPGQRRRRRPARSPIMASFMGAVDVFRAIDAAAGARSPTIPTLPENNFIDAPRARASCGSSTSLPSELCDDADVSAPRLSRRHRHAADAGRGTRASSPTSAPTSGPGWSMSCCERPGVRRLLGAEVGRPAARRSAGAGAQAGLRATTAGFATAWRRTSRSTSSRASC